MISPLDIEVSEILILTGTLGKVELEAMAALIVFWHQVNSYSEWTPVTGEELALFANSNKIVQHMSKNPFWRPDPKGLVDGGWVTGWQTPNDPIVVTDKLKERLTLKARRRIRQ